MKCKICGKEIERTFIGQHLSKEHSKMSIYDYFKKYSDYYRFADKDYLYEEYFIKKRSLKSITKENEDVLNISSLKAVVLKIFKDYGFKTRSISDAGKNYFLNNEVWNKGETKENNKFVKIYADKKKELYNNVEEKLKSFSIQELLDNFSYKRISHILKDKMSLKEGGVCPICGKLFEGLSYRQKQIHHIDRNHSNNEENNIVLICISCHTKISLQKYWLEGLNKYDTYEKFMNNINDIKSIINKKNGNSKIGRKNIIKDGKLIETYRSKIEDKCCLCGCDKKLVVHHLDGNHSNNKDDNLCTLCKTCHDKITGFNIKSSNEKELKNKLNNHIIIQEEEKKKLKNDLAGDDKCKKINLSKISLKEFVK